MEKPRNYDDIDRERETEYLKSMLPLWVEQNTEPAKNRPFRICPYCGSGTGGHETGAFSIAADQLHARCFSCNKGGDLLDHIGYKYGLSEYGDKFNKAVELYGYYTDQEKAQTDESEDQETKEPETEKQDPAVITVAATKNAERPAEEAAPAPGRYKEYLHKCIQACTEDSRGFAYLTGRGFTPDIIKHFQLGYDKEKDSITIPYSPVCSYYLSRSVEGKNFEKPPTAIAGPEPVYNKAVLYTDNSCFVCESPLDAISIKQAGGEAISIGGTGHKKLVSLLQDHEPKRCLILSLDNDEAGSSGQAELAQDLDKMGVPYIMASFSLDKYGDTHKDANDLLISNPEQLQEDITANLKRAREYELENSTQLLSVSSYRDIFKKHRTEHKQRISTGYNVLDKTLYGGFMDELYILSADTSIGKSAISCAIAQNIAASGVDVLYYCLEMGRDEFIARGISMLTREDNIHPIPYGQILNYSYDEPSQSFYQMPFNSYESYLDEYMRRYGEHLYYIEGGFYGKTALQIAEDAEKFKKEHNIKQLVIIVDYLQRLKADPNDRAQRDAMSITSAAVQVLGNLATQKHNTVIAISSISNAQKGQRVTDAAGKYSGDISFTGGILLGWNWHGYTDTPREDDKAETDRLCKERGYREMYLEVLKQRSGERNEKLTLFYYPAYNFFQVPDVPGKVTPINRKKKGGKK